MIQRSIERVAIAVMLAALGAQSALAATATVEVKKDDGSAAVDTVIVFDPLDTTPPPSRNTAVIDQINKRFVPKVSIVRTGTAVTFPNSDRIRHQVYSFSPANTFNLKLYAGSPQVDVLFNKPGIVVLGCNIHDTMLAFVGVVDSPYFAQIPPSGRVDVDLPAGRYRLRVWNSNLSAAVPARPVTVGSEPISILLTVNLDPSRETDATWTD